jgi:hypothetical protein
VNIERLPDVPGQEPGDFYYHLLRLPYGNPTAPGELPFEPDPDIADLIDISSDSGDQLGFVIVRENNTIEIVDALTGQHVRMAFGKAEEPAPDSIERQQLIEALMQASLIESKSLSVSMAELISYLQKKEHLAALGTFQGLDAKFKFLGTVLEAAARFPQKITSPSQTE